MKEPEKKLAVVGEDWKEIKPLIRPGDIGLDGKPVERKLVTAGQDVYGLLRKECQPVEKIDGYVEEVVRDLQDQLGRPLKFGRYTSACIGMAAPQLGELIRVFVVRLQGIDWVVINPVVTRSKGKQMVTETCESLPAQRFNVERAETFKVTAIDLSGKQRGYKGHGLLAAVLQHEFDHLNGICIDQVSDIRPKRL